MGDCHLLYFIMQHLSCLMSFSLHIKEFSAHLSLATVCNLPTEKKDRRLKCAYSVFPNINHELFEVRQYDRNNE